MANVMPISAAAAGTAGSPYTAKITSANVAAGTYLLTNLNFAGLGAHIPGWCLIIASVGNAMAPQFSTDNGTTWTGVVSQNGFFTYMDSASTVRLNIGSTTTLFFLTMDR